MDTWKIIFPFKKDKKHKYRRGFSEVLFPKCSGAREGCKNEVFNIKNHILKKNRVKNAFFYEEIVFFRSLVCSWEGVHFYWKKYPPLEKFYFYGRNTLWTLYRGKI